MGRSPGLCWLAAGALLVIASTPLAGPADLTPTTLGAALTKNLLYAAIAGLVILPGVFAPPDGRFVRVLSLPVLRHVGHLSYGIFCVHLILLELIADWREMPLFEGRGLELFALTLAASLVVSEVLHRLVERPALRLRSVWTKGSTSATTSAPRASATRS
jgi:peptidoglycan/LPS O-acetylase OafA/YrhL